MQKCTNHSVKLFHFRHLISGENGEGSKMHLTTNKGPQGCCCFSCADIRMKKENGYFLFKVRTGEEAHEGRKGKNVYLIFSRKHIIRVPEVNHVFVFG